MVRRVSVFVFTLVAAFGSFEPAYGLAPFGGPPRVAFEGYAGGDWYNVQTTAFDGSKDRVFVEVEPFASIDRGMVAVARHTDVHFASDVLVFDAETRELQYRVDDARFPLLFGPGRQMLFFPDNRGTRKEGDRDPYVASVWYRNLVTGEEHRLKQFPGNDFKPLQLAVSPDGTTAAFTHGNDSFLFEWDIYVAGTDGSGWLRLTDDRRSLSPSFSPDGGTIAFSHIAGAHSCSTGLRLIDVDGDNRRSLIVGTCDAHFPRSVWLDDQTLVAERWGRRPEENRNVQRGLVTISVPDGDVTSVLVRGWVVDWGVSRRLGVVAFRRPTGRLVGLDPSTGERWKIPGGQQLAGFHFALDGELEQSA
jgi:hypothetical protein